MPRQKTLQTNFSAGELDPTLAMRQDTEQYANGAKSLRNRRCLIGGGTKRRPGSWWYAELVGAPRAEPFVVNQSVQYVLAFSNGRMDAFLRDTATGALAASGSVTGCPWNATTVQTMDYAQAGNTMIIVDQAFRPQILTRTGAATWTIVPFAYSPGPGSRLNQPYFKVQGPEVTLAPSGQVGVVNIFASAPIFTPSYVNTRLRYRGREIYVTVYSTPFLVLGEVQEKLPPTDLLTVTSTVNFSPGEFVRHSTEDTEGEITTIHNATQMSVAVTGGLDSFTGGTLVGPNATTAISAVGAGTVAAIKEWDQEVFGNVYGFPGAVAIHRNRLLFAGSAAVPNGLAVSRIDNIFSFDAGDASDADGAFVTIGDAAATQVMQLYSAEQLIVLTDAHPYYVPESATNPFRPTSIAFYPFGSKWPATPGVKAHGFDEGVIYPSGSLVIKLRPTGDQTRSWAADEVSLLSSHIIRTPRRVAVCSNFGGGPERYAIFVNSDGTLALLQLVEGQKIRNVVPWDTAGAYGSAVGLGGDVYVTTTRTLNGSTRYFLERFDQAITLDLAKSLASLADVPANYGSTEVNVVTGNYHLGTYPVAVEDPPAGPYTVGLFYESVIETLPPALDGPNGPPAGQPMRITEALIHTLQSARFAAKGGGATTYETQAYLLSDPLDAAPPLRSGPQRITFLGYRREPTIRISQPDPLPLDVLAVKSEVVF
ncbi:MAG: hypothetical protein IT337_15210 [Thermomicrobiales bacterium]|nr:hypothetical protein [Thermomicrobiales bacterium]